MTRGQSRHCGRCSRCSTAPPAARTGKAACPARGARPNSLVLCTAALEQQLSTRHARLAGGEQLWWIMGWWAWRCLQNGREVYCNPFLQLHSVWIHGHTRTAKLSIANVSFFNLSFIQPSLFNRNSAIHYRLYSLLRSFSVTKQCL